MHNYTFHFYFHYYFYIITSFITIIIIIIIIQIISGSSSSNSISRSIIIIIIIISSSSVNIISVSLTSYQPLFPVALINIPHHCFLRDHNGNKAAQFFVLSLPSNLMENFFTAVFNFNKFIFVSIYL